MKLWETFRYEVVYQMRSISVWIYFFLLLVITFHLSREVFTEEAMAGGYFMNAPFAVTQTALVAFLLGLLILAPIAGNAAARDVETRMHPLLYTTPISKIVYLSGRFLAAFAVGSIVMTAIPAGLLTAALFPGEHFDLIGPVKPATYLITFFLFVLPNTFIAVALMFSVAVLSRRGVVTYLIGVFIFFAAMGSWQYIAVEQENWNLGKLMDPLGLTIMGELEKMWTPGEKNTLIPGVQTPALLNRLLWCFISLGILALTYFRFRVGPIFRSNKKNKASRNLPSITIANRHRNLKKTPIVVPQVQQNFEFSTRVLQVLTVARESLKGILMGWGGMAFTCLFIFVILTVPLSYTGGYYGPEVPFTGHLIDVLNDGIWFIIPLLIIYFVGELVWQDREAKINEITGVLPMPVWVSFAGKFAGLFVALVVMQLLLMIAGIVVQMRLGYNDFEIEVYLKILFGIQLVDYLLLGLLAFVIQIIVNQKYMAHLVTLFFIVAGVFASQWGIEPAIIVYGSDPGWSYSDMRGLEPFLGPWLLFKVYWAAWALLLAVLAKLLWPRGTERNLRQRLQESSRRFTRRTKAVATFAGLLILIFGGLIFYNTHIEHPRSAGPEGVEWKAKYEKRYSKYADSPQPRLTRTDLHVEIYFEQRAVDLRGSYSFVNRTESGIDSIHLATALGVENHLINFSRPARPELVDEELGHRIYVLEKPLVPGDSLRLEFHVSFNPQGFPDYGIDAALVENGSYFGDSWLPKIGYQESREIQDELERRKQGLHPLQDPIPDVAQREEQERTDFEAVVGTNMGQIAIAPGKLERSWTENGRSYFRYATEVPILNKYTFFSADYDVHEAQWTSSVPGQTVGIKIFYHPGHTINIERMVMSVRESLDYLTKQLGPYPHSEIRLIEVPGFEKGLFTHSNNIGYKEGWALLNPDEDPRGIDVPFAIFASEVSQQWWEQQISPADVEGKDLLTETLARNSALEIVEVAQGQENFLGLLRMMREYFSSPQARNDKPLLKTSDPNLILQKGPLAFYALGEYIGKEKVRIALQSFFKKYDSGTPPLPTSLDLYKGLQSVTPDSTRYLLHDLFAANTLWDLETQASSARQNNEGNWEVVIDVRARKFTIDTLGIKADVPMDDWVQIGIFESVNGQKDKREKLYLEWHRIHSGEQIIEVELPQKPASPVAGIDPNYLLMDPKMDDNIKEVTLQPEE